VEGLSFQITNAPPGKIYTTPTIHGHFQERTRTRITGKTGTRCNSSCSSEASKDTSPIIIMKTMVTILGARMVSFYPNYFIQGKCLPFPRYALHIDQITGCIIGTPEFYLCLAISIRSYTGIPIQGIPVIRNPAGFLFIR
jgi:hypothetical protein